MQMSFLSPQQPPEDPHILTLPVDIYLYLFRYVSVSDVLSIRQTCRYFCFITHDRIIWYQLLRALIEDQNLPIPGLVDRPLQLLSAQELETLSRRALRLRRNWTSISPVPLKKSTITFESLPLSQGGIAPNFDFLPGYGQRYMLTSSMLRRRGLVFNLQCWDLGVSPPSCIAWRIMQPFGWFAVNKKPGYFGQIGVQSSDIEILNIDFACKDPYSAFVNIKSPNMTSKTDRLVAFHASIILTRDEHHHLILRDRHNPEAYLELQSSEDRKEERVLEANIQEDIVIIMRESRLEIYPIEWECPDRPKVVVNPVVQHIWQWGLDSVSIAPETTRLKVRAAERGPPPINIILRFGSRLPWPVNLIHHFLLQPNASFDNLKPVASTNIPYDPVPVLQRQIGSPVRLFSNYHMAMGSGGTAIWIDNHTEGYFSCSDIGQRLAGSVLKRWMAGGREEALNGVAATNADVESSLDSLVFSYCENDEWARVAIDEEEGKIAVGCTNGTIVVYEYA